MYRRKFSFMSLISGLLAFIMIALFVLACIPTTRAYMADFATSFSPKHQEVLDANDNLTNENQELNKSIDGLNQTIETKNQELASKTNEISTLSTQKTTLLCAVSEIDNKINSTTDLVELEDLETRKSEILAQIDNLNSQIETLEAEKAQLQEEVDNFNVKVLYSYFTGVFPTLESSGSPGEYDIFNISLLEDEFFTYTTGFCLQNTSTYVTFSDVVDLTYKGALSHYENRMYDGDEFSLKFLHNGVELSSSEHEEFCMSHYSEYVQVKVNFEQIDEKKYFVVDILDDMSNYYSGTYICKEGEIKYILDFDNLKYNEYGFDKDICFVSNRTGICSDYSAMYNCLGIHCFNYSGDISFAGVVNFLDDNTLEFNNHLFIKEGTYQSSDSVWILNSYLLENDDYQNGIEFDIDFISNNTEYNKIYIIENEKYTYLDCPDGDYGFQIYYGDEHVYSKHIIKHCVDDYGLTYVGDSGGYYNQKHRILVFEERPTGDLLTWLEANATEQV